jgi:hypothetical protein
MPSLLPDLAKFLSGSRESVLPSSKVFPLIDVEQLASELRVDSRGREDGQANLPPTDSSFEPVAEGDIRAEVGQRASRALHDYQLQLDLYEGRIKRGLLGADVRTSIEAAGESALSDFRVQAADDLGRLELLGRDLQGRQGEFDAFRSAHRLQRLPRPVTNVLLRRLVIVLLLLVETIINGLFFAQGSETGLIGGVLQAAVLSLFNVGLGFTFGRYLCSNLGHVSLARQLFGGLATLFYGALTFAVNLSIGHFRDLYIQYSGAVPLQELWAHLTLEPTGLADTRSLLLVGLGVVFNLTAAVDAFGLEDPYPGYGVLGRRKEQAITIYADQRTRCLSELQATRDEAIGAMSHIVEEVRSRQQDVQLAVSGRVRLHQQYSAYVEHLSDGHSRLVQRYREANLKARTSPPPERFSSPPSSPISNRPLGTLADLPVDSDDSRHVIERMEFFIRALSKEYDTQVARYTPVNALMGSAALGR